METEGIAFGPEGNLYVASEATDEIFRYNGLTGVRLYRDAVCLRFDDSAGLKFGDVCDPSAGGPLRELATPSAPCSIASRTTARIRWSSSGVGGPARFPRTWVHTCEEPT